MLPRIRTTATAAVLIAATAAAPAHAWGEKEQNALAAIVAAGVVGTLLYKNHQRSQGAGVTRAPIFSAPNFTQPVRQPPVYTQPRRETPVRYQAPAQSGIHDLPAARVFSSYGMSQRRAIQSRLQGAGYYQGGIDGAFGPQTYRAVLALAGDTTGTGQIETMGGAYEFYDALLQ